MNIQEFLTLDLEKHFRMSLREVFQGKGNEGERNAHWIQEISRRHNSYIGRQLEESCEKCEEPQVYCGYFDAGGPDHSLNFWHICLNCLDAKFYSATHGVGQTIPSDFQCPYCSYPWEEQ